MKSDDFDENKVIANPLFHQYTDSMIEDEVSFFFFYN